MLFAILAFELGTLAFSLPAIAAQFDKMRSTKLQYAVATPLSLEPGLTRLVISSNGPFILTSEEMVGQVDISVHESGLINVTPFGDKAQLPGPQNACANVTQTQASNIYVAHQATSTSKGEILDQSVIFELRYAKGAQPEFKVVEAAKAAGIDLSENCDAKA